MKKLNEKGPNTVEFTVLAIACFVMLNILLRFTPFGAILAQRVDSKPGMISALRRRPGDPAD
jgi:hypothetical protein